MRKRKVVIPQTYHYNLLLRIVRDCSLGDEVYMQQLIHRCEDPSVVGERRNRETRLMQSNQPFCTDVGHQGIQVLDNDLELKMCAVYCLFNE